MTAPGPRVHVVGRWEDCPALSETACAVVFDVLRATTAMVAAAAAGVSGILPVGSVDAARAEARALPEAKLAGERHNQRIPGFDFGNTATDWSDRVGAGFPVIWTTTNGTQAMDRVAAAGSVLAASFSNRRVTVERLRGHPGPVWLVAAGTRGSFSLEDWLCCGAVASGLPSAEWDDAARAAVLGWQGLGGRLYDTLRQTAHAQELLELGLDRDIEEAALLDRVDLILEARPGPPTTARWLQPIPFRP